MGGSVITEPELVGEPEPDRPADLVSDEDRRPLSWGTATRRPWVWALGGIAVASALWAGLLQATGYGHAAAPDLHGFHVTGSPCTTANLEPLTDAVSAGGFSAGGPSVRKGPALDHISCGFTSSVPAGDGWAASYALSVTVDLHKKTDPRGEFQDTYDPPVLSPTPEIINDFIVLPGYDLVTRVYPGLGDLAYFSTTMNYQTLSVLYGGVVLSLSLDAHNVWQGGGATPTNADGSPKRPFLVDTTSLRPLIPQTMRHLMSVLSGQPDPSGSPDPSGR
jgi:hypothetical protein